MTYAILLLANDPWQVFTADVLLDGEPFHAQISVRWLPADETVIRRLREILSGGSPSGPAI